jgi:hypothetical protein
MEIDTSTSAMVISPGKENRPGNIAVQGSLTRKSPRKFIDPFDTQPVGVITKTSSRGATSSIFAVSPTRASSGMTEQQYYKESSGSTELRDIIKDLDDPAVIAAMIKEKLQKDYRRLQEQRSTELQMKSVLDSSKLSMIEQYQLSEEKLRQEILDQKRHFEELLQTKEAHFKELLQDKETMIEFLKTQHQASQEDWKAKLQRTKDDYIQQLERQEQHYHQQLNQSESKYKTQYQALQQQVDTQIQNQKILEGVHLETKEKAFEKKYTKKLLKYEKKVTKVIKHYQEKELVLKGALEEVRRELQESKAQAMIQEQNYQEELMCKDKRLILIQQDLDRYDRVVQTSEAWKEIAHTLASYVVHACTTVEDLPKELWTVPTIGMFTSVYDQLQCPQDRKESVDPSNIYQQKRKDCVLIKRLLMAKCLKYSKVSIGFGICKSKTQNYFPLSYR